MNWQNLTKFCIHLIIDKIYVGIKIVFFSHKFATELRPLIDVRIQFFSQYFENEVAEFNQIMYTHDH